MKFEFYFKGSYHPTYLDFSAREECEQYVNDNREHLLTFSTHTSGLIAGLAAEIDETKNSRYEEVALLYPSKLGNIWIESR